MGDACANGGQRVRPRNRVRRTVPARPRTAAFRARRRPVVDEGARTWEQSLRQETFIVDPVATLIVSLSLVEWREVVHSRRPGNLWKTTWVLLEDAGDLAGYEFRYADV